jgi:hypothetical protein
LIDLRAARPWPVWNIGSLEAKGVTENCLKEFAENWRSIPRKLRPNIRKSLELSMFDFRVSFLKGNGDLA